MKIVIWLVLQFRRHYEPNWFQVICCPILSSEETSGNDIKLYDLQLCLQQWYQVICETRMVLAPGFGRKHLLAQAEITSDNGSSFTNGHAAAATKPEKWKLRTQKMCEITSVNRCSFLKPHKQSCVLRWRPGGKDPALVAFLWRRQTTLQPITCQLRVQPGYIIFWATNAQSTSQPIVCQLHYVQRCYIILHTNITQTNCTYVV